MSLIRLMRHATDHAAKSRSWPEPLAAPTPATDGGATVGLNHEATGAITPLTASTYAAMPVQMRRGVPLADRLIACGLFLALEATLGTIHRLYALTLG